MAKRLKRPAQAALVIVSAFVLLTVSSAKAATVDIEFVNTGGEITITGFPAIPIPPDTGGMNIAWDDVTGDVSGVTTFNPFTQTGIVVPGTPIGDVTLDLTLTFVALSGDNVSGNIDPATGEAVINTDLGLVLGINITSPQVLSLTCTLTPLDINWTTGAPDGVPMNVAGPRPYSMTLQAIDFVVPAINPVGGCGEGQDAVVPLINTALALPTTASAVLPLEEGFIPPPTTTTSTSTSTSTTMATTSTTGNTGTTSAATRTTTAAATTPRFTG